MNYQEMSDFEINKAVADKLGYAGRTSRHPQLKSVVLISSSHGGIIKDYCNSWADAGPIAQRYNISIHAPRFGEGWMAEHIGSDECVNDGFEVDYFEHHHENPCLAICIVFLMMKGGE